MTTYMRHMRNNNLDIRIAGSSCRPQLILTVVFWRLSWKFWRPTGLITFVFWSCREFSKPMTLLWLKNQEYVMSGSYLIGCPFLDREYEIIDLRKWEGTIKWNKLVFYLCLYNKQNIIWPLGDRENFSSRVEKYCNTQRFSALPCNILCVK